ncbi:MAG: hypothetical protein QXM55_05000 [Ignisphaera sp.]
MQVERANISIDIGFTLYRLGRDLPCIAFVSGVTGNDGCGYVVLRRVIEELKNKTVHGSILIIPQVNEINLAYSSCSYAHNSSIFCRLVDKLVELIPRECPVIEVRCRKGFVEHIVIPRNKIDEQIKHLVEAIPIEYAVKAKLRSLAYILGKRGFNVATIILNCGKEFSLNEVDKGIEVIIGTLANLGFLKKKANRVEHRYYERYYVLRCSNKGIFTPSIANYANVVVQTVIGTIDGVELRSPVNGLILYVSQPRLCSINEIVSVIAAET